jgi:SAM-dependent methyltransferase
MLRVATEKIEAAGLQDRIDVQHVDIRDMACFAANQFDLVLAEGDPISYCLQPERAVREIARVVKPNRHVIVSVDNKYSAMIYLIRDQAFTEVAVFYETGIVHGTFPFQTFTPDELRQLVEASGLTVVRLIGKPVLIQLVARLLPREQRDAMIEEQFQALLDLELQFCDAPSLVGAGGHLEIVGVKQRPSLMEGG